MTCEHCGGEIDHLHTHATGPLCASCVVAEVAARARPIEVVHRGVRFQTMLRGKHPVSTERAKRKNARKQWRRTHDPELSVRHRKVQAARQRALRRLRALYPDVYDLLYAEERAAAGLEPLTPLTAAAMGRAADAMAKLPGASAYHAVADFGETHDPEAVES